MIQLRVSELHRDALTRRFEVPVFTLYGDGTLIYTTESEPTRLLQTKLPDDAVRDLLKSIVDTGFLNFSYVQPEPAPQVYWPTTFLYAYTLDLANAVSAYALDTNLPQNAGDGWDQFRATQEIAERLRAVDPVALGGSEPEPFVPDAVILFERLGFEGEFSETLIEGEEAMALVNRLTVGGLVTYLHPGSGEIGFLPILPYEEIFPEFDIE